MARTSLGWLLWGCIVPPVLEVGADNGKLFWTEVQEDRNFIL